jgi:hypothetical protein
MAEEESGSDGKSAKSKAACPYCMEPVKPTAIVCKTCQRDIALPMSLKSANDLLQKRVEELEAEVARLEPNAAPAPVVAEPPPSPPPRRRGLFVIELVGLYIVLPILVLVAVHYLLIVRFDTKLAYLRAASIAVPALFGWILASRTRLQWFYVLSIGIVVGLASVFGMATVIHYTDGDAIMPDSAVAWRETIEYGVSIALSYLLGSLVLHVAHPLGLTGAEGKKRTQKYLFLAVRMLFGGEEIKPLMARIDGMEKLMTRAVAASTAAGALYTGFKGVF